MMNKLREVQPPVIPFIGTYLSSLCFLDESGKTKTVELKNSQPSDDNDQVYEESVKIDFASSRRTAGLIQEIQMYQNEPYQFQVEPSIRGYCN
ncbi:hypothetical protein L596_011047 [Steinernema carpocapsae]|uniref:Uncharacterized protein n=1 Tax=Steinernema carpocapsae TaxID=34508 RepID=A0A4U5NT31_STECR|nr:hypothetical protein L596_011047 [Steinernema carpocapsae]